AWVGKTAGVRLHGDGHDHDVPGHRAVRLADPATEAVLAELEPATLILNTTHGDVIGAATVVVISGVAGSGAVPDPAELDNNAVTGLRGHRRQRRFDRACRSFPHRAPARRPLVAGGGCLLVRGGRPEQCSHKRIGLPEHVDMELVEGVLAGAGLAHPYYPVQRAGDGLSGWYRIADQLHLHDAPSAGSVASHP